MRILVGYDGSPPADAAIRDLIRAGLPQKAEARVLMVIRPWIPPETAQGLSEAPGWFDGAFRMALAEARAAEKEAREIAGKARDSLLGQFPRWKVDAAAAIASPVHGLLDSGQAWKPDLIVVGSHGRGALGRLFLGSVARKILDHAGCPVRIGRSGRRPKSTPPRLLFGMDGSPDAMQALKAVARRPWPRKPEARILTVMDFALSYKEAISDAISGKSGAGRRAGAAIGWPWMEKLQDQARSILEQAGIRTSTRILQGEAPKLLVEEARRFRADCIHLGSRGLTGMGRFFLGSVSGAVAMQSHCSVEIHRRKDWEGVTHAGR